MGIHEGTLMKEFKSICAKVYCSYIRDANEFLQSFHIFIFTKGCLALLQCITQGTTKTCVKMFIVFEIDFWHF